VSDDEVLAAGFAYKPRIAPVAIDVVAHLLPHAVEDSSAAGEVDAREIGRIEEDVRCFDRISGTKLMTPGGRPAPGAAA
jgi:hypothetical protein